MQASEVFSTPNRLEKRTFTDLTIKLLKHNTTFKEAREEIKSQLAFKVSRTSALSIEILKVKKQRMKCFMSH